MEGLFVTLALILATMLAGIVVGELFLQCRRWR
jgi:hypothetical protein